MNRKTLAWCICGVIVAQIVAVAGAMWPLVMVSGGVGAFTAIAYLIAASLREDDGPVRAGGFDNSDALDHWRAKTEVLISWADGTAADWDRHIRPILGREYQMALGGKPSKERGEYVFGEWWQWVDPIGHGSGQNGPGRHGLDEILKRLEMITTGEAAI